MTFYKRYTTKRLGIMALILVCTLGITIGTAHSEDMTEGMSLQLELETLARETLQNKEQERQEPEKSNTGTNLPQWVRSVAGFWASGLITDAEFMNAIQYMINNNLITITNTTSGTSTPPGIIIDLCERDDGGYVFATGRFTADTNYRVAELNISLLDSNGNTIYGPHSPTGSYLYSIENGETRAFVLQSLYKGAFESCRVSLDEEESSTLRIPTPKPTQSDITLTSCTQNLGRHHIATGTFTANANYSTVFIYLVLTDTDGKVYDKKESYISNISNGETRTFSITSDYWGPTKTCNVIIDGYFS